MADPAPIIATVLQDPWLRNNVTLRGVITVFDAVEGRRNLTAHPEVVRQIAIGDVVVVTKSDLRGADDRKTLEATIATYVPDAQVFDSHEPGFSLASIIPRSDEHTSELQSLMRISYAVFCLKKQNATCPS